MSFSAELHSIWVVTSMYWCLDCSVPMCWTLHFSWLNFTRFPSVHFSSLPGSLWKLHDPVVYQVLLPVLSSANLLRVCSALSSRSITKLDLTGPSNANHSVSRFNKPVSGNDPWGTLHITGLQLDFVPKGPGHSVSSQCTSFFPVQSIYQQLRGSYGFPLVNICWLLMIFMPLVCLTMVSRISSSIKIIKQNILLLLYC